MFYNQFRKFEIDEPWKIFCGYVSSFWRTVIFSSVSAAPAMSTTIVKYIWENTEDEG